MTKGERLKEFFRRLELVPTYATFEEAYVGYCAMMDAVEDELSGAPNVPDNWMTDGRMYPPQMDYCFEVEGHPNVKRLRSAKHSTFIGTNGAIETQLSAKKTVVFRKSGANGKGVWDA